MSFDQEPPSDAWTRQEQPQRPQSINLAPLKRVLESDPVRSKVLRILIDDGGWVTTTDLLKVARQTRPILGAVTIGTMLNGMNELVSSRLVLSRTALTSGFDWAEWRINPDWLDPTRKLLQMIVRSRPQSEVRAEGPASPRKLLEPSDLLETE